MGKYSYSDYKKGNFDCGRYKSLKELNKNDKLDANEDSTEVDDKQLIKLIKTLIENNDKEEDITLIKEVEEVPNNEIDEDFVFSFKNEKSGEAFCGGTIINDREV